MYRKLIYLVCLVLVLGIVGNASADLVLHWPLDEGSGATAVDMSGNGHDGAIGGTANWVAGQIALALDFDGSSTYIDMDDRVVEGTWSLAMWLKPRDIPYTTDYYAVMHTDAWAAGTAHVHLRANTSLWNVDTNGGPNISSTTVLQENEWYHCAYTVLNEAGGNTAQMYINGVLESEGEGGSVPSYLGPLNFGAWNNNSRFYHGLMDDIRIYDHVLSEVEVMSAMEGEIWPYAWGPEPADGAIHADTWVSISWKPGGFAVSHDVYFSDNFDDVNVGAESTFQGNQPNTFFVVGFPGFPYPEGLAPGTTYYWRIDEVNDTEPNSPWVGPVWSFTVPPKNAYAPDPPDGAKSIDPGVTLSWTGGFGSKLHTVYFGDNFDDVNNATGGLPQGATTYTPANLKFAKTYYWRVDEFDAINTYKGEVWSFTTEGAVGDPNPSDGAVDVKQTPVLSWTSGVYAASHQIYFGTDEDTVRNADTSSPEYQGTRALGIESYEPSKLQWDTTYYWRIDEVNDVNPDGPWTGDVWSFTTANFLIVDDFENYDAGDNQIWYAWKDGLGYGVQGTDPYYPGNGSGSAVGDETTDSYTEETIVHGGSQAMPLAYDNNKQGFFNYSEAELTLTSARDWTENGVNRLAIWYRGNPAGLVEEPAGTYTMSGAGTDVWDTADEFRYAYKQLSGAGSISAQVLSVQNTNGWAKAGVMIRETLNPGSKHAFVCVTPSNGVASQHRPATDSSSVNWNEGGITAPHWVKLERDATGRFTAYHSANGVNWEPIEGAESPLISMSPNVYIGLALTSHTPGVACIAEFSNVQTTGTVSPLTWTDEAIGTTMATNVSEPMYVALNGNAVVFNDNPNATLINEWTEWNIDLQEFAAQGVNLANVNTIALGFGDKNNPQAGGSGVVYFDDIRLYPPPPPEPEPEPEPEPAP